jgi:hypothetical protein
VEADGGPCDRFQYVLVLSTDRADNSVSFRGSWMFGDTFGGIVTTFRSSLGVTLYQGLQRNIGASWLYLSDLTFSMVFGDQPRCNPEYGFVLGIADTDFT